MIRRAPILRINLDEELVVDSFAGGGGASDGIRRALGREPDIAINHDPEAIAMHKLNHPKTRHLISNVNDVDPVRACGGKRIGLFWLSPDCTYHSKARGGKPHRDRHRARRIRGLANLAVKWASVLGTKKPRVIMLENVEEFADWGPLLDDGTPCPIRKGLNFRRFVKQLQNLGYQVDWQELRACDFGAPTTRRRLFLVARCDGLPIAWPEPTHGYARQPYRTAAECIDWSLPCPSIFDRRNDLADNTLRRIARGIRKYVIETQQPFIVGLAHGEHKRGAGSRSHGIDQPLRTIHAGGGNFALVAPSLIQTGWGERKGQAPRALDLHQPIGTIMAGGCKHALVAAFLAKHYGGHETPGTPLPKPFDTITAIDHHALITSNIIKLKGTCRDGQPVTEPLHTIQAGGNHYAEVRAFLLKYYGTDQDPSLRAPLHTIRTKDCFALVTVAGEQYAIADIGMRMLEPRELFNAQGFGRDYKIDPVIDGKVIPKYAQVRMCGNSVSPNPAEALVAANLGAGYSEARRIA